MCRDPMGWNDAEVAADAGRGLNAPADSATEAFAALTLAHVATSEPRWPRTPPQKKRPRCVRGLVAKTVPFRTSGLGQGERPAPALAKTRLVFLGLDLAR